MKLLDKYLLQQFGKHFLTVNVGLSALYLLVDFIEKFDNFSRANKSFGLALKYFMLNLPFVVDQLGPILILLSGVISLGILSHTNELTALKAAGLPLKTIIRPILIGGVIITVLLLASAQWILPTTAEVTNAIWYEQVKGKVPLGIFRNGRYYYKGKEGFYSFEWPNPKKFRFRNFSYSRWDKDYKVRTLISSKHANWEEGTQLWSLGKVQIQEIRKRDTYAVNNIEFWQAEFPEKPEDFLIPQNEMSTQSLIELFRKTGDQETESQTRKAWANFLGKLSYSLLGLPLLLLGLPILLISYRKWGRDLSVAIPVSCGLAFIAWGAWGALQSLAIAGRLPPLLAAVVIHLLFASTGIYLLRKQDR